MTDHALAALGLLADGGRDGGGGGYVDWTRLLTPGVLVTLLIVAVVAVLVLGLLAWLMLRRLRRGSSRQLLDRGLLTLRASRGGPAGELAALRLRVASELAATGRAIAAGQAGGPAADLPNLMARLTRAGSALDTRLRLLESEADRAALAAGLPAARQGVEQLEATATRIRQAATLTGRELGGDDLAALSRDVDDQVTALSYYVQSYRELGGGRV